MRPPSLGPVVALALLACTTPEQAAESAAADPAPPSPAPTATAPAVDSHGIDVSHHSGAVDWAAVAADGYVFAYLKATEGVDNADPTFAEHWQALADHPIYRGAYHFYVTEDDPEEQARFFLSHVDHRPGDLAPVVDIELIGHGTVGDLAPPLRRFLQVVEEAVGVPPIIYTSPNFWNAHLDASFARYPLWIAEYGVDQPLVPAGWDAWTLWQFDGDAMLPGVEKGADRSRVHPRVDLRSLRIPPPAAAGEPER